MSSPYAIILKEIMERKKWKKIHKDVAQVENTRNEALKEWEAFGFENQDAMQVWFEKYDQSHSRLDEVAKQFGKDSKQYKYNHFVESIALAKITPEGFKPPMSTAKKGALVAGVAAAAGAAAFVATKLMNKKPSENPYIVIDIPVEADVDDAIDGTKPQIDVPEDLKEKMAEILANDDYKKQLADLTAQTNQKVAETNTTLNNTYSQINDLCANSGVVEKDVTGIDYVTGVAGLVRKDGESLMSMCVRGLESSTKTYDAYYDDFCNGFEENFPHYCQVMREHGRVDEHGNFKVAELCTPPGTIKEELLEALRIDEQTSSVAYDTYVRSDQAIDLLNAEGQKNTFAYWTDLYLDKMPDDQSDSMQNMIDQANGCYESFENIVLNYNQAVQDLQQSWIDNNLVQALSDALLNSNIANDTIASNIDFDGNELANKIVDTAKDVADQAAKVAADVLENTFGM